MTLPLIGSTTMKPLLPALLLGLAGFATQAAELRFVEQYAPADPRLWLEQQLGVPLSQDPAYERQGLLGRYLHFRQQANGAPIAGLVAAISLDDQGRPWRLYHNTRPVKAQAAPCDDASRGGVDAYIATLDSTVWTTAASSDAEPWFWLDDDKLIPAWRLLASEKLPGNSKSSHWQLFVSCDGGALQGRSLQQASTTADAPPLPGDATTVAARVFALDPRTQLQDGNLLWRHDLVLGEQAYRTVTLPVQKVGDTHYLSGPRVRVVGSTEPDNEPFSSDDAAGFQLDHQQPGFLDINAYYHLDLARRHLDALGYDALIAGAITIDTDAGNQDNSLYDPFLRQLEIGRTGVPDAEDPMVIWHEFGHAVQNHILPDMGDEGDWGAIGEGFSDYLAASWRQRSEEARQFEPFMVFNWDARISGRTPRQLDDLRARYHPGFLYPAHLTINGSNGDQLWGTPLFTALRQAVESHGEVARDEFDRLLIESHFGLGPELRMPQLARVTVDTARRLYPERRYAELLEQAFRHHALLPTPVQARLADGSYLLPGEKKNLAIELANLSGRTLAITDASLLPVKGLLGDGHWQGRLAANESGRWSLPLEAASNLACGEMLTLPLQFQLDLPSPTERQTRLDLQLPIGEPVWQRASGHGGQIKDATSQEQHGLSRFTLTLPTGKARIDEGFVVALDLTHDKLEQLEIWLTSPYGTRVSLWNKGYASHTRLKGEYPHELVPFESLEKLKGEPLGGLWTLEINDTQAGESGQLREWRVAQQVGARCTREENLPTTGVIPLDKDEGGGGSLSPLLLLLALPRLWCRRRTAR
ncbi:proprotein convertase P-domain-containing protein [Aeromonas enteropelogenes]|uniref:proprotein convertase P-domain-containing protein n=1 Tax=Aeromonas enteropelogenes TaxID=29489 RepID=UPI0022854DF6|nr:proprotein convertase P-domain-containing protein [Aeromonas enteropelogenes]MCZ0749856.1 proprotein convertase P-domain-containing protein [Aeromonas enteropelogenes]